MSPAPTTRPVYRIRKPWTVIPTKAGYTVACTRCDCDYQVTRIRTEADAERLGSRHSALTHGGQG